VEVEFVAWTGATRAAAQLGAAVEGRATHRTFRVRRLDAFARWLLSLAGDAVPRQPARLVDAYRQLARGALGLYQTSDSDSGGAP